MTSVNLPIIGSMHSPYREKFGIPRQPNLVQVQSYIEMYEPYNVRLAFDGIEEFSHLWLIWQFHENKNQHETEKFRPQVRPPRLGGNKKIGVFATRSMYRPAPIGLSVVQFKSIEKVGKGLRIYVTGSDLLDGTPILDIKPYIHYSDAIENAQSGYAHLEPERKQVCWKAEALRQQQIFMQTQQLTPQLIEELEQVLSLDPRPAYQDDIYRVYKMKFAQFDISFSVNQEYIEIIDFNQLDP
ncbi:tRNA (N6-threonylcarbamoyladenosine(37)-N6)-methyltransferase TrmO [Acinetobacter sp. S40]|uniref:tRNA (N6-threonylcarbamoyladenosine(37)-N6)-methyltransferase TrmO n=1 Tax=unclassified Acinetobacter TaxID=196816 RepID=UPI00190CB026|nr:MULTISPECIES: tRNA (N6-threonylcarbamoyladenosine(37)-N6)-methyltransferase TrmO [unclassified Acinetobacter]MBJ9984820.1 tRNA (N6-threonylcarbamoyladenosine(37)-N6)-methyltransferase TrmO [Acinetobacter sp. S40]MBK0063189.1 tRNA (N6-threonylcarbamoyladenosine(37)-N6)-methyltransferase TrmO [Acinetobacter sp. S55]MBK0066393.1 tRNA (N6-threonylcarbamoyladenosine(37)-N6)-methyltransferase TrmO [Acinetobacter sp. S54]